MVLEVVKYGHPVLRKKGEPVAEVNAAIQTLIADMFDTMRAYKGIGLAAQQVGVPIQLTILDVREIVDRPSWLKLDGREADVAAHMPVVLINPELKPLGEIVSGPEGCLSFPEIYADIPRPETVDVKALDAHGKPIAFRCGGLLARAVQHETDHLHGILFIDRMDRQTKDALRPELDLLQAETRATLRR
jgi:peptide deformylase